MAAQLINGNFWIRTLSGAVFVAVVAGAVLWSPWSFGALLAVVCTGCLWEFYGLASAAGADPQRGSGLAIGILLVACGVLAVLTRMDLPPMMLVALLPLTYVLFIIELYRRSERPLLNVASTLAGVIYAALPLLLFFFMANRRVDGVSEYRPWETLAYFAIVWANDTGAYLFGVAFGRHRLFERISPKKSWEGFFGGIVVAVAVAVLTAVWMGVGPQECILWAGLGLVVAIAGVFGDLVESMFKRSAGRKDSGGLMPGHGGFLDRFDALLMSVPFAFIYILISGL